MIYNKHKSAEERMNYIKGHQPEETVLEAFLQAIPVVLLIALILYTAAIL